MSKKHQLAAIATLAAMCLTVSCHTEKAPQWQLVWEENFDGPVIDTAVWSKIPRGPWDWNKKMSAYDSLYDLRDGQLWLYGIATPDDLGDSIPYITAGVWTKDKLGFERGRLEIRAKLSNTPGAWPAIWLMPMHDGGDDNWPWCGEIDIMERLNGDSVAWQTVHSHYCDDLQIYDNPPSTLTAPIDPNDYNTYAVELYPDSVVFYINDVRNFGYPRLTHVADSLGQFPFDKEWYLMLDMQLGGNWVGPVDTADLPALMQIDWVKYYKQTMSDNQ